MKILGNNYSYSWLEEDTYRVLSEIAFMCDKLNIGNISELRQLIDEVIQDRQYK